MLCGCKRDESPYCCQRYCSVCSIYDVLRVYSVRLYHCSGERQGLARHCGEERSYTERRISLVLESIGGLSYCTLLSYTADGKKGLSR